MSQNRLELMGVNQDLPFAFGNTLVVGTSAEEVMYLDIGIDNVTVNISDDDAIYFGREAAEYSISRSGVGNQISVVDSNTNTVLINIGGVGKIGFQDGEAVINIDVGTGSPMIAGTIITSTIINAGSFSLSELPESVEDAGYAPTDFLKIIDGGNAYSVFV